MSDEVFTVPPTLPALDAWQLMSALNVRQLVVKDGSVVVGVLTDGDAGGRHGAALRARSTVADLMDRHFAIVARQDTVRKAANLIRSRMTSCVPVVEHGRLFGVVGIDDLLSLLGRGVERPNHAARVALHHRVPHRRAATASGRW